MGHVRIGVVVRDSHGHLLVARSVVQNGGLAPAVVKAKTALLAIHLCHEMGLSKIHFEGDAKSIVDSVNSELVDSSWMGHVIEDIKVEIQVFYQWQFSFVGREGNKVAHLRAKYARKFRVNHL
jgi:hypothetical protein